jgi:hypothetical protein
LQWLGGSVAAATVWQWQWQYGSPDTGSVATIDSGSGYTGSGYN